VLANGEVIETGRLTRRELSKKLGLTTFEGEVYRSLDALIEENKDLIQRSVKGVSKNAAGYNIFDVKRRDGSFDLTPLFVGSQGTLGVITEITCETEAYNPETVVFAAFFDSISAACESVQELRNLAQVPSAIEFVDGHLLKIVNELNPNQLKDVLPTPTPAAALIVELDDAADRKRKKTIKQVHSIFEKHASSFKEETTPAQQAALWKIRHASATLLSYSDSQAKAVPLIEDGVVPLEKLDDFIAGVYRLFTAAQLDVAIWGHAGDGNLHVQPFLDISQLGDRQRAFRLMDEYYALVTELGGSTTGQHNDGRLRGPYLEKLYGHEIYELFKRIKTVFDPYNLMNPGVKIGISSDDVKPLVKSHYSLDYLYKHMPRS
jgi:FAD/FMN-containing dehydrogenase